VIRRALAVAGAAALITMLAACGSSSSEGGSAEPDPTTASASVNAAEFPSGWPADLTVIPGFSLLGSASTADTLSAQMYAEGDQSAAVDAYVKDLQANKGWSVDPSVPLGMPNMWALTKEGKVVMILSGPSNTETVVAFSVTNR
jgi:hypothetical protein